MLTALKNLITDNEEWLLNRVLYYARERDYFKYAPTLKDAWQLSIKGLSNALINALNRPIEQFELGPDDNYRDDPISAFGIHEAKIHRSRGISIEMFLGLMKYYRESYHDLLREKSFGEPKRSSYNKVINRFFDRMEIGLCIEWAISSPEHLEELQEKNRFLTNDKNKYLTIFESFPHAVILLKKDLSIENLNRSAIKLLKLDETLHTPYYSLIDRHETVDNSSLSSMITEKLEKKAPDVMSWFNSKLEDFIRSKKILELIEKKCIIDGSKRCFNIKLAKMRDVSNKYSGIILILQDLTSSRRTESEKAHMEEQLLQSDKMASIGQLAAGVAHEINNPTGFVGSNLNRLGEYVSEISELLQKYQQFSKQISNGELSPTIHEKLKEELKSIQQFEEDIDINFLLEDVDELIDESKEGTERIRNIVSNLKDFAHPEKSEHVYANMNKCIESTLSIVWNEIKYKSKLIKELGDIPEVYCEPRKLNQVFMNIIVNAAHSIEKDGEILIQTIQEKDWVVISFQDNGSGIKEKDLNHIFNPFFTTKPVGKGTGLGLHIAYQIIEQHKGTITVHSKLGEGTRFVIRLPITPPKVKKTS